LPKVRKRKLFGRTDGFIQDAVKRKLYEGYSIKKLYSLDTLLQELDEDFKEDNGFPYRRTQLSRLLKKLGFKFKKIDKKVSKFDFPENKHWRFKYLNNLAKYRQENRLIIYLDETWFDSHEVYDFGWTDSSKNCVLKIVRTRGKRLLILHAGSANGWVKDSLLIGSKNFKKSSADYHEDMSGESFESWFKTKLLPNLSPNAVIVMDNASVHSRLIQKILRKGTRKADIINFMENNNIPIPTPIPTIPKLLELISTFNIRRTYIVDELAKDHGFTVERLPPYHCIFNPIEMIWGIIKQELRKINVNPLNEDGVVERVRDIIENKITPEIWRKSILHVQKLEQEYISESLYTIIPIVITPEDLVDSDTDDEAELQ